MNSLILSLVFAVSATAADRPLCKGNKKMSREAIQSAANNLLGGPCKISPLKQNMSWPSEGIEGYAAEARCPGKPVRRFHTSVKKDNGVCHIRFTKMSPMDGSQCGLTDMWGGEEEESAPQWKFKKSAQIALQDLTPAKIHALPEITKQQLIANTEGEATTAEDAVKYIVDNSEAGEGYVHQFSFKGKKYDAVESYPGGNSYGKIFPHGSAEPIAENGDGSISCLE